MGFLSSIKRLFFTTESVAKSAVDKATDNGKETIENVSENVEKVIDQTRDVGEKIMDKTSEAARHAWDITKNKVSEVADKTSNIMEKAGEITKETLENVSDNADTIAKTAWDSTKSAAGKVIDTSTDLARKIPRKDYDDIENQVNISSDMSGPEKDGVQNAKEILETESEKVSEIDILRKVETTAEEWGEKIMDKGEEWLGKASLLGEDISEKAVQKSDQVWEKISEVSESLQDKADNAAEKIKDSFNAAVDKAEAYMAEENAKPKKEFAEDDLLSGPGLLEGNDDFFSKAGQYADGDHQAFNDKPVVHDEAQETVQKAPSRIAGEQDADGDGNELIDDAQILDEDK